MIRMEACGRSVRARWRASGGSCPCPRRRRGTADYSCGRGSSATEWAAACANWLQAPTTKVSKVNFGFKGLVRESNSVGSTAARAGAGDAIRNMRFETDVLKGKGQLANCLAQQGGELRLQPCPRLAVRDGNEESGTVDAGERRTPEPVVVAFGADFLLQIIADLIPKVHGGVYDAIVQISTRLWDRIMPDLEELPKGCRIPPSIETEL